MEFENCQLMLEQIKSSRSFMISLHILEYFMPSEDYGKDFIASRYCDEGSRCSLHFLSSATNAACTSKDENIQSMMAFTMDTYHVINCLCRYYDRGSRCSLNFPFTGNKCGSMFLKTSRYCNRAADAFALPFTGNKYSLHFKR